MKRSDLEEKMYWIPVIWIVILLVDLAARLW